MMTTMKTYCRGSIYFVDLPIPNTNERHSVETGRRPVLIVSGDVGNLTSSVVNICPLSTKIKELSCNVDVGWTVSGKPSQVLCNQVMTLPKNQLSMCIGVLTTDEMLQVDRAIKLSLGLR